MTDTPASRRTLTPRRMLKLQAKLNALFVRNRDTGASTARIYTQLKMVEGWLSANRIFW